MSRMETKKRALRVHTREFKAETVALVRTGGRKAGQVARELGLADSLVRTWVHQADVDAGRGPAGALTSTQFVLDDRAQVLTVAGGFAGVGNAGSVTTQIGNDASLGDILSVAPVRLFDRVTVQGSIRSHGTVTLGNGDNVSGSVTPSTTVSLPPVRT